MFLFSFLYIWLSLLPITHIKSTTVRDHTAPLKTNSFMLQHPRQHQIGLVNIGHVGRLAQRPAGSSEHGQCGSVPFRRIMRRQIPFHSVRFRSVEYEGPLEHVNVVRLEPICRSFSWVK